VSWLKYHSPFLGKNVSVALKGTVTQEEYVASGRTHWDLYTNHEGGSAVHYLVLKMHKNHFFNAPAVSLMTLLLRACAWNWHYNADTFEGLRKGIIEGVYSHNEKSYFQRIFSKSYNWELFFKHFHKIASTVSNLLTLELNYTSVGGETKEYLDKYYTNTGTIADTMHNYSGIIAAVTACQTCWDLQVKGTNSDNVSNILIAANYQRIVKEQLKKDNALVIPAKFKKDGEIQWEKVKKADLWGTVLAKYVGAVMP
jgi:hypothetical protein